MVADVNYDGDVTLKDAQLVLMKALNIIQEFPPKEAEETAE